MPNRFIAAIIATLVVSCIAAPGAFATQHTATTGADTSAADEAMKVLSSVKGVHVGMNATTVTILDRSKSHPIVIDYGDAFKTGALGVNNTGSRSSVARGSSAITSVLPQNMSIGQIAVWLLGLTLVSRVIAIARQVMPRRPAR